MSERLSNYQTLFQNVCETTDYRFDPLQPFTIRLVDVDNQNNVFFVNVTAETITELIKNGFATRCVNDRTYKWTITPNYTIINNDLYLLDQQSQDTYFRKGLLECNVALYILLNDLTQSNIITPHNINNALAQFKIILFNKYLFAFWCLLNDNTLDYNIIRNIFLFY
jgi:hypothetical protein